MADFVAEQDQIVSGSLLTDMTGDMPKIDTGEELGRFAVNGIIPPALPGRDSELARLRMIIYRLHNTY